MRIHEIITELTYSGLSYNGLPCTKDCSGSKSGFDWSKKHKITDPSNCISNNGHPSFSKSCAKNAADQRDGKFKISPPVRSTSGKFQKFQPEKPDRKKFHQKPEVQEPRNDSNTTGY
jgi:hypothetical protein